MAAQVVLRNGLRVFLVQDPDVPLVKGTLRFRGGLRASPAEKVGQGCVNTHARMCLQLALPALQHVTEDAVAHARTQIACRSASHPYQRVFSELEGQ